MDKKREIPYFSPTTSWEGILKHLREHIHPYPLRPLVYSVPNSSNRLGFHPKQWFSRSRQPYCWWKKSQTPTWEGAKTLVNSGIKTTFPSTGELSPDFWTISLHQHHWLRQVTLFLNSSSTGLTSSMVIRPIDPARGVTWRRAKASIDHRCGSRGCTRAGGRQIHVERLWILAIYESDQVKR